MLAEHRALGVAGSQQGAEPERETQALTVTQRNSDLSWQTEATGVSEEVDNTTRE